MTINKAKQVVQLHNKIKELNDLVELLEEKEVEYQWLRIRSTKVTKIFGFKIKSHPETSEMFVDLDEKLQAYIMQACKKRRRELQNELSNLVKKKNE